MSVTEQCENEETEETVIRPSSKGPCLGQRHLLAFLSCLGIGVMYCMRVNLSVALVAMVNATAVENNEKMNMNSSECPVSFNSSAGPSVSGGGTFVWSRQLQGLILSSFFWGYLVFQLPAGTLTQRFGGKWTMLIGVLWTSAFTALTPIVAEMGPYWLITFRVLEGLGEGVTFPTIQSMLGRWIPAGELSFLVTLAFSGGYLGTVVGQLSSGPLCESEWGWPSAFYVSAVAAVVWCLPWIIFVSNSPETNRRISAEELTYITYHLGRGNQEKSNQNGVPWCRILTDRAVWAVVFNVGASNWIFYVLLTCLPQYLSDVLHFDISRNGLLSSLPYVVALPVMLIVGFLADVLINRSLVRRIVVRKGLCLFGYAGIATALYAITLVPCNAPLTIVLLITTVSLISFVSVGTSPNMAELSPLFCGTLLGLANSMSTVAGILAPYVTDRLTPNGTIQEWRLVLYVGVGVAAFGGIEFAFFGSSTRRDWGSTDDENALIDVADDEMLINQESANEVR